MPEDDFTPLQADVDAFNQHLKEIADERARENSKDKRVRKKYHVEWFLREIGAKKPTAQTIRAVKDINLLPMIRYCNHMQYTRMSWELLKDQFRVQSRELHHERAKNKKLQADLQAAEELLDELS